MSCRIVLYAEGPGEDRGTESWLPDPAEPLGDDLLGPAHRLIARWIARERSIAPDAVTFLSPLKIAGRPHRGSDLLVRKHLPAC